MSIKISACIITFNEEKNIRRCLDSVSWCDEIVILDSFSTDSTISICREYTDKIYQHEWMGYVGQRNLVREKANCDWVLYLDADEEVSSELQDEILREKSQGFNGYLGYQFPRRVEYLGRWILHGEWYPDIKLRLFKKIKGRSVGTEPHDYVTVDGNVKTLKNPINHYTYRDISDHIQTVNHFASIAAAEKYQKGERHGWSGIIFRSIWRFIRGYIIKMGFLDGHRGYLIAVINSFGVIIKYAKLWEIGLQQQASEKMGD
jgi:glycosyltransferase involved in cell wall biosynthesis